MTTADDLTRAERYPRSSGYDPNWVLALDMGPHPLWQLEDLLDGVALAPGSRVLDLGAGLGATSVYLVREHGCEVVSLDLWVSADERQEVADRAGVGDHVTMLHADVRTATLEPEAYDAIISVDAFEYFGTDTQFLPRLLPALRPGGLLAMSTPALRDDPYTAPVPPHVHDLFGAEVAAWHAPAWWQRHWELTGMLDAVEARWQPDGGDSWLRWERARGAGPNPADPSQVVEMLEADVDEHVGFALVTARKR
ncbi:cyclopropane-fatty-acyl-phospholipid synthase family protein [Angustibacter peucedani]